MPLMTDHDVSRADNLQRLGRKAIPTGKTRPYQIDRLLCHGSCPVKEVRIISGEL